VKRRLLNLLTLLSLLLCVAVCVLWVRSHRYSVWYEYRRWDDGRDGPATEALLGIGGGSALVGLSFRVAEGPPRAVPSRAGTDWSRDTDDPEDLADGINGRFGFGFERRRSQWRGTAYDGWHFAFPLWLPAMLLAIPPAAAVGRALRRRRPEGRGLCRHCGYDLTGNVSGVCPECGVPAR